MLLVIGAAIGALIMFIVASVKNEEGMIIFLQTFVGGCLGAALGTGVCIIVGCDPSFVVEEKQTQTLLSFDDEKEKYYKVDGSGCVVIPQNDDVEEKNDDDDDNDTEEKNNETITPQTLPANSYSFDYTKKKTPTITTYTYAYKAPWDALIGGTPIGEEYETHYVLHVPEQD